MSFQAPAATFINRTGITSGKLGTWMVIASEIIIFGGLVTCYLLFRTGSPHWAQFAAHTNTWAGALNTLVLLTSSLFIVLAHAAVEHKDYDMAYKFIWRTVGCGLIFICVKIYEYSSEFSHNIWPTTEVFWSFYFAATGLHAAHVVGGMVIMTIIAADLKKGLQPQRVEFIGLYWHFVDLVWIFLFPLLYIAK